MHQGGGKISQNYGRKRREEKRFKVPKVGHAPLQWYLLIAHYINVAVVRQTANAGCGTSLG